MQPVISISDLTKIYAGGFEALKSVSLDIDKGEIFGLLGPNGAGKTTLFRMLTGTEQPDSGEIRTGNTVEIAYVDQSRDALDNSKTVWRGTQRCLYESEFLYKSKVSRRKVVCCNNNKAVCAVAYSTTWEITILVVCNISSNDWVKLEELTIRTGSHCCNTLCNCSVRTKGSRKKKVSSCGNRKAVVDS